MGNHDPVATRLLGHVQRTVGGAHQDFGAVTVFGNGGDTGREGDGLDFAPHHPRTHTARLRGNRGDPPDRLVGIRAGHDDEQFLATVAAGNVRCPQSVDQWQKVASPVWMDINPSDTLQYQSAREHDDERHICPLQLEVIRRGVDLWTNTGDVVLSPFAGIGSEGHVSLQMGRKFIGIELKESYYQQAARNLQAALRINGDLFAA